MQNYNNTGNWVIGSYTDNFGDPTGDKFIENKSKFYGTFTLFSSYI